MINIPLVGIIGFVAIIASQSASAEKDALCEAAARYAEVAFMEKEEGVSEKDSSAIMMLGLSQDNDMKSLDRNEQAIVASFVTSIYQNVYSNNYKSAAEASKANQDRCSERRSKATRLFERNKGFCQEIANTAIQINKMKLIGEARSAVEIRLMSYIYKKERLDFTESIINFVYSNDITDELIQIEYMRCLKSE